MLTLNEIQNAYKNEQSDNINTCKIMQLALNDQTTDKRSIKNFKTCTCEVHVLHKITKIL